MDHPERYEQLLAFLGSQLPAPIDEESGPEGAIVFSGGDPVEVVVHLTATSVIVSEFAGEWETPFHFVAKPRRVGIVKWRRLPETAIMQALAALIKGARDARLAKYQTCRYCGKHRPPEWLHDEAVCQACAERHGGAIH